MTHATESKATKTVFYAAHGLDKQRAYNIICLMVGGDPDRFSKLAGMSKVPDDRQGSCRGDFSNASWSWERALTPHIRRPDHPKTKFTVRYVENDQYELLARAFRETKLLELLANHLSDRYIWRRPIGFEMASCGFPNAHWDIATQKITVCYELAADFAELYRDYGAQQKVKPKSAGRSGCDLATATRNVVIDPDDRPSYLLRAPASCNHESKCRWGAP